MRLRLELITLILLLFSSASIAQQNFFVISDISIEGNKKTKDGIIYREMDILKGDTIPSDIIAQKILENEKRILSTGLFTKVKINIKDWDEESKRARVEVALVENWYIYPTIIFELADRNFNVWWDRDDRWDRINYGARLSHINLTGQRDKLKFIFQQGFTKKYELDYNYPYLNKEQTFGIRFNVFYSENNTIGFKTVGDRTAFHKDTINDRTLLSRLRLNTRLQYRPSLYQYHNFNIEFHRNWIDDFVATELNPDYFLEGKDRIRFFRLNYEYRYDKRIYFLYPEGGYQIGINLDKQGLGIFDETNIFSAFVFGEYFHKPMDRLILATRLKAKTNFSRGKVAFANNTGLGYGQDYVGGYEIYVMDGTDYILTQSSARFSIIEKVINLGKTMPLEQFRPLSARVFLTFNFDAGYVKEPTYTLNNNLVNQWNVGFGPGLDIILYNNWLFQFEYSFNQLGEKGLYIHNSISF